MKILDGFGIEDALPSIVNPANTSYVVISRETERFVNEIHDHKEELRSSNELFTAERESNSSQETGALNSIKETWQAFPSILLVILYSRKRSFSEVNENGLRWRLTHHQGAVCYKGNQDGHEDGSSL